MKITKEILQLVCKDTEGNEILEQDGDTAKPLTFVNAIRICLRKDLSYNTTQGRVPDIHEEKKYEIYMLLLKLNSIMNSDGLMRSKSGTLTSEEITLIKQRAKKLFSPELYGWVLFSLGEITLPLDNEE